MHENKGPQWTPELETRYQYVQKQYDNARSLGVDILKTYFYIAIALNIVPMVFNEKLLSLFPNGDICFIYGSWICLLLSLLFSFFAYFFVFYGYYYSAHKEALRWLGNSKEEITRFYDESNRFFGYALWLGKFGLFFFVLTILLVIIPVSLKIYRIISG